MSISLVSMTHHRDAIRTRNQFASLMRQSVKPAEIIMVDTGTDNQLSSDVERVCRGVARYIHAPSETFNQCRAFNIGIKATSESSKYIGIIGCDTMFSNNFVKVVLEKLELGSRFVLAISDRLPEIEGSYLDFTWGGLKDIASGKRGKKYSPGAIQAADRNWWFKVRGYDEAFDGGLGGMDDDMKSRAQRDGLVHEWITFGEAQVLHQWHPRSKMKGKTSHMMRCHPDIVKNLNGWGEK